MKKDMRNEKWRKMIKIILKIQILGGPFHASRVGVHVSASNRAVPEIQKNGIINFLIFFQNI